VPRKRKRQPALPSVQDTVLQASCPCSARIGHTPAFHQEVQLRGEEFLPWRLIPILLPPRSPTAHRYFLPATAEAGTQTDIRVRHQGTQTEVVPSPEFPFRDFPLLEVPPPVSPLPESPPTTPHGKPRTPGRRRIRPVPSAIIKALQSNRPS